MRLTLHPRWLCPDAMAYAPPVLGGCARHAMKVQARRPSSPGLSRGVAAFVDRVAEDRVVGLSHTACTVDRGLRETVL